MKKSMEAQHGSTSRRERRGGNDRHHVEGEECPSEQLEKVGVQLEVRKREGDPQVVTIVDVEDREDGEMAREEASHNNPSSESPEGNVE